MYSSYPIAHSSPYPASPFTLAPQGPFVGSWVAGVYGDYCRGEPAAIAGVNTLMQRERGGQASSRDRAVLGGLRHVDRIVQLLRAARGVRSGAGAVVGRGGGGGGGHGGGHGGGGHGGGHRGRGGWGGYGGYGYGYTPGYCTFDAAGNVWCLTPWGWQVQA